MREKWVFEERVLRGDDVRVKAGVWGIGDVTSGVVMFTSK